MTSRAADRDEPAESAQHSQSPFWLSVFCVFCVFCVVGYGAYRAALAESIVQSLPLLRSVKFQTRGSTRGSPLPTFVT